MLRDELDQFFNYLKKSWLIFGPAERGFNPAQLGGSKEIKSGKAEPPQVLIERLENFEDLVLDQRLPFFSFKKFFVPECEVLFKYKGTELISSQSSPYQEERAKKIALFGINLLDLKSILLYDQVFEKDPWYQARRQNILIIGHSLVPDLPQNIFEQTFEEDVLEHLSFDVFLASLGSSASASAFNKSAEESKAYAVFTGSARGQKVLEEFGYNDYIHIQFSGPVKEGKLDERMVRLKDKLKNQHNQKIWDELGKRCLECGKCTVVCPTCFCFRIDDQSSLDRNQGQRQRSWDSCFFQEFSEVAGGNKFLKNTAQRIHFWYYHKFARIPEEFDFMGCVGCRRCSAVCPVGIDIAEVLKEIEES